MDRISPSLYMLFNEKEADFFRTSWLFVFPHNVHKGKSHNWIIVEIAVKKNVLVWQPPGDTWDDHDQNSINAKSKKCQKTNESRAGFSQEDENRCNPYLHSPSAWNWWPAIMGLWIPLFPSFTHCPQPDISWKPCHTWVSLSWYGIQDKPANSTTTSKTYLWCYANNIIKYCIFWLQICSFFPQVISLENLPCIFERKGYVAHGENIVM